MGDTDTFEGASTTPPYGAVTPPYNATGEAVQANVGQANAGQENVRATPPGEPPAEYEPVTPPLPPTQPVKKVSPKDLPQGNPNTALSRKILDTYFRTFDYPFTRHHIDSFDQFLGQDLPAILKSNNPILLLKEYNPQFEMYMYRVEVFIGGLNGDAIEIGTPTISLQKAKEVRVLFPNEARLRNLSYTSTVYADVLVRVTINTPGQTEAPKPILREYKRMPLFQMPILLHSRYCLLHGKPASFLTEAGECPQDQGGYFIIDGAEKVLITKQEQAFNTLYCQKQPSDPQVETYGNITCLSPETRQVKVVSFHWMHATQSLVVTLPYVRKPVPIFVLFRAMGVQSDKDILELIYPDLEGSEAKMMMPLLLESIAEATPFFDTYSAFQYIKAMTKGFSTDHVYDILFNQTFIHITDKQGGSRVHFLAECVRRFMRVHVGFDPKTDRDDTRNQRCLTSGFLIRMLFNNAYANWKKAVRLAIDSEYEYAAEIYSGAKFINIFSEGNTQKLFINPGRNEKQGKAGVTITQGVMRGFKGKWVTGGAGGGGALGHSDEKSGVLQAMSRLSYMDFMSHCRRVNLNFDTGMKLTGPRQLHTSQYGYFCTNETPGGASIGISKNLSLLTLISTATNPDPIVRWLYERSWVIPCSEMRTDLLKLCTPFFVNNGIIGYTLQPFELTKVLKLMKWTGCLSALASVGFSIRNRKVFLYVDEGRPCRPLIHLKEGSADMPKDVLENATNWRNLVMGTFPFTSANGISTSVFVDPLADKAPGPMPLTEYIQLLEPHAGVIEYVDPYEQNEAFIVNFPEHLSTEASHLEIHPSTIVSVVNGMIPFANFNQSPRNQLSCSQSKQGLSLYATNFQIRYDNTANILCYGEAPLVRTLQYDYLGGGQMPYGHNIIMAIMPFHGYNQDDGIVFNADSFQRGMFRNINYRSYETFEEKDIQAKTESMIANPLRVPQWTDLRPGLDYTKLDERGIIKVGELVDENTVLVGKYIQDKSGKIKDSSLTPQVWTSGRVESVVITVNNLGKLLVKVRITQDRTPELGDKFSTRHGQKGTIGMIYRAHDLPRTADGLVPDMIVNPHCIPSRMTVAQLMEMLFGEVCNQASVIGDATLFVSDPGAPEAIGRILESQFAMEKTGNNILYDGASGVQMPTTVFMGPVYGMRLKHMVEDKWNARAEGRREQKTRQPTGGRGAQGGLRIGEMERDALTAHGITGFLRESMMERADKAQIRICNGCGTVPIYNDKQGLFVCSLCDGPVKFAGSSSETMELMPTVGKSLASSSIVEMPYATKLLADELQTYMNMGMRIVTGKNLTKMNVPDELVLPEGDAIKQALSRALPDPVLPDARVPEYREAPPEEVDVKEENLIAMGVILPAQLEEDVEQEDEEAQEVPGVPILPGVAAPGPAAEAPTAQAPGPNMGTTYYTTQEWLNAGGPPSPPFTQFTPPAQNQGTPAYAQVTPPEVMAQRNLQFAPQTPPTYGVYMNGNAGQSLPPNLVAAYQMPLPVPLPAPQQAVVMGAPVPGAPNTFVVDTGPAAMAASGFQPDQQDAVRGVSVMGSSGTSGPARMVGGTSNNRRHTTPRRAGSPRPSRGPAPADGAPPPPSMKITVQKLG